MKMKGKIKMNNVTVSHQKCSNSIEKDNFIYLALVYTM